MPMFGTFDPLGLDLLVDKDYASVEEFLAEWDSLASGERPQFAQPGRCYVYAFRDAARSVFYVGKGTGDRAHDADGHRHGRLGYYVANILDGGYTVELLRSKLSQENAELLEALLIEKFSRQLVNTENNGLTSHGVTPDACREASLPTYAQMREVGEALRVHARATAADKELERAVFVCRDALARLSEWERCNSEIEIRELERRAVTEVVARVDLHRARNEQTPYPPVPACDILGDLTRYLCRLGRADEAQREVDAFTERYPHGSFREYESGEERSGRTRTIPVTQREQATLRRIQRALTTSKRP